MAKATQRRVLIVVLVTLYNLLAEYSLRGINHLMELPALALLLFLNYFPYFLILEDLIGRYRLKDYQLYCVAFAFAVLWQLLGTAVVFLPPQVLGFNLFGLLFNNFIWWTTLQTVLPFYLVNRVLPRTGTGPLLPKWGLLLALLVFSAVSLSFRGFVKGFPMPTLWQLAVMVGMIAVALAVFIRSLRVEASQAVDFMTREPDRVLDITGAIVIVYLIFSAVFLTSGPTIAGVTPVNATALRWLIWVSLVAAATVGVRRWMIRRSIPL